MDNFFDSVAAIIDQARSYVGRTADLTMCVAYFEIGRMIVEQEQAGSERADYGSNLLSGLSKHLNNRFGKGFSETNLKSFRKFYLTYAQSIRQTASAKFEMSRLLSAQFDLTQKGQAMSAELYPFRLSWSHYQVLMRIQNEQERGFYEIEAANQQWTVRQLQRQYNSSLYERLGLSRDKDELMRLAWKPLKPENHETTFPAY